MYDGLSCSMRRGAIVPLLCIAEACITLVKSIFVRRLFLSDCIVVRTTSCYSQGQLELDRRLVGREKTANRKDVTLALLPTSDLEFVFLFSCTIRL